MTIELLIAIGVLGIGVAAWRISNNQTELKKIQELLKTTEQKEAETKKTKNTEEKNIMTIFILAPLLGMAGVIGIIMTSKTDDGWLRPICYCLVFLGVFGTVGLIRSWNRIIEIIKEELKDYKDAYANKEK